MSIAIYYGDLDANIKFIRDNSTDGTPDAAFGQSVIYLQDLLFFTPDKSLTVATAR